MAPSMLFRFISTGMSSTLIALHGEKRVFNALLVATILGLAADCVLIPYYKASGAAMGMFVSAICQFIIMGIALMAMANKARTQERSVPSH
jgi:O-antigen/teichoic acid export membrane protein